MNTDMQKKTLFGVDKTGGAKEWSVWTEGAIISVEHGKVGGKKQIKTTTAKPKNVGRANETTAEQQAASEAQSKWNKQYDKYYRETVEEAKALLTEGVMLAQDYTKKPHFLEDEFYSAPKLDGCFSYNTLVMTDKGSLKIGDIVEKGIDCKALSFNETSRTFEFKNVVNRFNNGYKDKDEWLSFKSNGQAYGVTKNHKVLTEHFTWDSAENSDTILKVDEDFSGIITGMLLGDTCAVFEKRGKNRHTRPMWRILHSVCDLDKFYGVGKCDLLKEVAGFRERVYTSGYGYPQIAFTSTTLSDTPFDIGLFYNLDKGSANYGKRVLDIDTTLLRKYFTDTSLLLWYLDDGSLAYNNGNLNTPRITLDVSRYSDKTLAGFVKLFKLKYCVEPSIGLYSKAGKTEKRLSFKTKESVLLLWRMAKVGGKLLPRKFPEGFTLETATPCSGTFKSYTNNSKGSKTPFTQQGGALAYDIEVEDNHNYLANGCIVHNCRVKTEKGATLTWNSRGGKTYPIPPQVLPELEDVMNFFGLNQVDGEGIVHGIKLQKIQSCIKKPNELTPQVVYEIFDIPMQDVVWWKRWETLGQIDSYIKEKGYKFVSVVPHRLCTKAELNVHLQEALAEGFEGLMMRNSAGVYSFQNQRSNDLLKYKLMFDDEAKVIDCKEDKNGQGLFTMEYKSKHNGNTVNFELSMNGSQSDNTYEKLSQRIGEWVNFKYQDFTEDGVPTFARGLYFRECDENGNPQE